jgi:hypothetical protein
VDQDSDANNLLKLSKTPLAGIKLFAQGRSMRRMIVASDNAERF